MRSFASHPLITLSSAVNTIMIRFKYLLTPIAWVQYSHYKETGQLQLVQRELLLFGIRIFVKTM